LLFGAFDTDSAWVVVVCERLITSRHGSIAAFYDSPAWVGIPLLGGTTARIISVDSLRLAVRIVVMGRRCNT
jgi:hypothetical protein